MFFFGDCIPRLPQVVDVVYQQADVAGQAPLFEAAAYQLVTHMSVICLPVCPPLFAEPRIFYVLSTEGGPPTVVRLGVHHAPQRADSSPSSPFILGLGRGSTGAHAVMAGVCTGGHLDSTFPAAGLGGGAETTSRPLAGILPPTLGLYSPLLASPAVVAGP
jgi:hypothetical protein